MNDSIDKQPANDRRSRTRKEIKQLIAERNEVLSLYCQLAGCDGGGNKPYDEIDLEILQEFCQVLIDYIATGHFELYSRISEGGWRGPGSPPDPGRTRCPAPDRCGSAPFKPPRNSRARSRRGPPPR